MLAELNIVGIIIAIVVAIIASLVKKKEEPEEFELPPELKPKRERRPAPPKVSRWEEELRRALGEQAPPPIVREVPPPVIYQQPPPLVPQEEYQRSPYEGPQDEPAMPRLHTFTETAENYTRAASLLERTQEHLHQLHGATHRAAAPATVQHAQLAPEVRALVDSLRQPGTARAAILASIVLGPPRALET